VLNDPEITRRYRVVAFDMPWHGKSSPPAGWQNDDYRLTTGMYTEMIMEFARAMKLERPVVMGCSIGGRIVLDLALKHARELRALVGLQSGAFVERYYDSSWLDHPEVHGGRACGAVAYGLMSPLSPENERWETVWHYMQGGPGVFTGDLHFYQVEGDIRGRIGEIDTRRLPALSPHRRVRLLGLAARYRGGGGARQGREVHGDERPRAFPHEREPGGLPRLSQASAGRDRRAMTELAHLFLQLFVIIAVSRAVGKQFTRIGLPAVVGEMTAGILLGPSLFGWLAPGAFAFVFPADSLGALQLLSQAGICLFMFAVGMELDLQQVRSSARTAVVVSQASIVVPFLFGVGLAYFLYHLAGPRATFIGFALFMGISMSITAFPVLARILQERGLSRTPLGSLAITCAAINDVAAWGIMAFVVGSRARRAWAARC
jgi:pimeloyl-ACP methyl ester carboxylesterase